MTALHGRQRIWLTGATSGIGRALAERLLAQGHRVALSARSESALGELAGDRDDTLPLPLDVSDRAAVRRAGERLAEAFGGLDLVILNAGTCEYLDARDFDLDLVERVFAPNLFGALHCVDAALPLLRRARAEVAAARRHLQRLGRSPPAAGRGLRGLQGGAQPLHGLAAA